MSELMQAAIRKARLTVEDLLGSDATVFFENVFSTRHIGKVVDLMAHQCRGFIAPSADPGQVEYRFRHIVELLVFNGWSNYRKGEKAKCIETELGFDKSRLVISIACLIDEGVGGFVPGAADAPANATSERIAKMFTQVQALADGLVIRHDPRTGRLHAVAFLSAGAASAPEATAAEYIDLATIPESSADAGAVPSGSVVDPVELSTGDVDAFLTEDGAAPVASEPLDPASETTASTAAATDADTVVSGGGGEPDQTETRISGDPVAGADDTVTRIGGGEAAGEDKTVTKVSGGPVPAEDTAETKISGGNVVQGEDRTVVKISGGPVPTEDKTVTKISGGPAPVEDKTVTRISSSPVAEVDRTVMHVSSGAPAAAASDHPQHSKREQLLAGQIRNLQQQIEALKVDKKALQDAMVDSERAGSEALTKGLSAPDEVEETLEIKSLKKEMESGGVSDTAKQLVQGMMESLVKERSEIKSRMHEVDNLLRKREFEFKTREATATEQIRKLDELLKQRDSALEKSRETVAHVSGTLERMRKEGGGPQDGVELAHKLVTAEKLIASEKETVDRLNKRLEDLQKRHGDESAQRGAANLEAVKLKKQVDDLQRKLTVMQEAGAKGSSAEVVSLTLQRDKNARIIEELKRQMSELQSKLSAVASASKTTGAAAGEKKGSGALSEAEMKHKLELAEKIAKNTKDELDKLRKRLDESKGQEAKLRTEVAKVQGELAKALAEAKAAGFRSANASTAAGKAGPAKK